MNKKVILMILDGWGKSPDPKVSAIDHAETPFIDSLYKKYPITLFLNKINGECLFIRILKDTDIEAGLKTKFLNYSYEKKMVGDSEL